MDIIKNRARHPIEDEDTQPAEPVRNKRRATNKEASVEHSRLRKGKAKVTVNY